jgi:acyl-CoA hydrolase
MKEKLELSPLDLYRHTEIIKRLDKIVALYNAFEVITEGNN